MKLSKVQRKGGYTTAYRLSIGSKEARDAGFIRNDGTSKELRKEVNKAKGHIIFSVDTAEEQK